MSQSEMTMSESSATEPDVLEGMLDPQELPWADAPSASASAPAFGQVKSIALVVGFGFVWAASIFAVQQITTTPSLWKEPMMVIKDVVFRFLFDWSAATLCFAILPSRFLAILFALNLWVSTAVLSFFANYQRALSWVTISNQTGEGMDVAMVALEDAAPYLTGLVPLSVALLWGFHRIRPRLSLSGSKYTALVAAAVWIGVFLGVNFDHKPLKYLEKFESADGMAYTYGFVTTWIGEGFYVNYDGITDDALARLKLPVDRLMSVVPPTELGERIAVVQVESLDDAVMNFQLKGREVTPRLNAWAKQGNYLRVQAPKKNGSCDSDFALLFGALPSERMAPYKIPAFPFDRSLAKALHDRGLYTSAYHNVNGTFFERRTAFEEMDFDSITFREELIDALELEDPEWTIEDGKMFRYATDRRHEKDRFFEFSITGTSHTPFRFSLEGHPRTFFPDKHHRSFTYFDTINYVDKVLGEYVDGLPNGTVVVIYGDHWSRMVNEELNYDHQMFDEFGVVPALLFRKTAAGIKPVADIEQSYAKSAKMRLADMTAWLRASLGVAPATEAYRSPRQSDGS